MSPARVRSGARNEGNTRPGASSRRLNREIHTPGIEPQDPATAGSGSAGFDDAQPWQTSVACGLREEDEGVDRFVFKANFKVQVGVGRRAGCPDQTDDCSLFDLIANLNELL